MAEQKQSEVRRLFTRREVKKHMAPLAPERYANWQLFREEPRDFRRAIAERKVRIPVVRQVPLECFSKVRPLVILGPKPTVAVVGKNCIQ